MQPIDKRITIETTIPAQNSARFARRTLPWLDVLGIIPPASSSDGQIRAWDEAARLLLSMGIRRFRDSVMRPFKVTALLDLSPDQIRAAMAAFMVS